jgi:hypothetical protein
MKINNFKKIQEEDEQKFLGAKQDSGRTSIWGTLGIYKFVGQLVEVYLPKAVDVIISAAGAPASRQALGDGPEQNAGPEGPSSPGNGRA